MIKKYSVLFNRLGYEFKDDALLSRALTHRSAGKENNERLEFLGDAILNFIIGELLYQQVPFLSEGDLSRMRASLVNRETLAAIGMELEIGEFLALGQGELKSGGYRRKSIIADSFEAIVGAIYLDSSFLRVRSLIHELFEPRLAALPSAEALKDAKTRLQELLQSRGLELPIYEVVRICGETHAQTFDVQCTVESLKLSTQGSAGSRRRAEQIAAANMLSLISNE